MYLFTYKPYIRIISILVVVCFILVDVSYAFPQGSSTPSSSVLNTKVSNNSPLDITSIKVPYDYASIESFHKGHNGKTLIHIQDAHSNYSGQKNIASTLKELIDEYSIDTVLVEGGYGDVSLNELKSIASKKDWDIVANKFLMKSLITGPEYLNLTTNLKLKLLGLEDKDLYESNVLAYSRIKDKRQSIKDFLHSIQVSLDRLKYKLYPKRLIHYEETKDPKDFTTHFNTLLELIESTPLEDLNLYPNIKKLKELTQKEDTLDFTSINEDQKSLWNELNKLYPKDKQTELTHFFKSTPKSHYATRLLLEELITKAKEVGIPIARYPYLLSYFVYLEEFNTLKMDTLMQELESLEDHMYGHIIDQVDTKKLRAIDRYLNLVRKAYDIKLTTNDYKMLKYNEPIFKTKDWMRFINQKLTQLDYKDNLLTYKPLLENSHSHIIDFYTLVEDRDKTFLHNTNTYLKDQNKNKAFIITGGYHTEHLTHLLKKEGYSLLTLTPNIEHHTDQSLYEKILLSTIDKYKNPSSNNKPIQLAKAKHQDYVAQLAARLALEDRASEMASLADGRLNTKDLEGVVGAKFRESQLGSRLAARKIFTVEAVEIVRKVFDKVLEPHVAEGRGHLFDIKDSVIFQIARLYELGKVKEEHLEELAQYLIMEALEEFSEAGDEPADEDIGLLLEANDILKAYFESHGLPFREFANRVLFTKKKIGGYIAKTDTILGLAVIPQELPRELKLLAIIHEAVHILSDGFPITELDEGLTEFIAINAYLSQYPEKRVKFGDLEDPKDVARKMLYDELGDNPASNFLFSKRTQENPDWGAYLAEVIFTESIIDKYLTLQGIGMSEFLQAYVKGDVGMLERLFTPAGLLVFDILTDYNPAGSTRTTASDIFFLSMAPAALDVAREHHSDSDEESSKADDENSGGARAAKLVNTITQARSLFAKLLSKFSTKLPSFLHPNKLRIFGSAPRRIAERKLSKLIRIVKESDEIKSLTIKPDYAQLEDRLKDLTDDEWKYLYIYTTTRGWPDESDIAAVRSFIFLINSNLEKNLELLRRVVPSDVDDDDLLFLGGDLDQGLELVRVGGKRMLSDYLADFPEYNFNGDINQSDLEGLLKHDMFPKLLPVRNNPDSVRRYLAVRNQGPRNEFIRRGREILSEVTGHPEEMVLFFNESEYLLSYVAGWPAGKSNHTRGTHTRHRILPSPAKEFPMVVSYQSDEVDDLEILKNMAHEVSHEDQVRHAEKGGFEETLTEGFQIFREYSLIKKMMSHDEHFSGQIEHEVESRYQGDDVQNYLTRTRRLSGDDAEDEAGFDDKLITCLGFFDGYFTERQLVHGVFDVLPATEGDYWLSESHAEMMDFFTGFQEDPLRDTLGHNRFDALKSIMEMRHLPFYLSKHVDVGRAFVIALINEFLLYGQSGEQDILDSQKNRVMEGFYVFRDVFHREVGDQAPKLFEQDDWQSASDELRQILREYVTTPSQNPEYLREKLNPFLVGSRTALHSLNGARLARKSDGAKGAVDHEVKGSRMAGERITLVSGLKAEDAVSWLREQGAAEMKNHSIDSVVWPSLSEPHKFTYDISGQWELMAIPFAGAINTINTHSKDVIYNFEIHQDSHDKVLRVIPVRNWPVEISDKEIPKKRRSIKRMDAEEYLKKVLYLIEEKEIIYEGELLDVITELVSMMNGITDDANAKAYLRKLPSIRNVLDKNSENGEWYLKYDRIPVWDLLIQSLENNLKYNLREIFNAEPSAEWTLDKVRYLLSKAEYVNNIRHVGVAYNQFSEYTLTVKKPGIWGIGDRKIYFYVSIDNVSDEIRIMQYNGTKPGIVTSLVVDSPKHRLIGQIIFSASLQSISNDNQKYQPPILMTPERVVKPIRFEAEPDAEYTALKLYLTPDELQSGWRLMDGLRHLLISQHIGLRDQTFIDSIQIALRLPQDETTELALSLKGLQSELASSFSVATVGAGQQLAALKRIIWFEPDGTIRSNRIRNDLIDNISGLKYGILGGRLNSTSNKHAFDEGVDGIFKDGARLARKSDGAKKPFDFLGVRKTYREMHLKTHFYGLIEEKIASNQRIGKYQFLSSLTYAQTLSGLIIRLLSVVGLGVSVISIVESIWISQAWPGLLLSLVLIALFYWTSKMSTHMLRNNEDSYLLRLHYQLLIQMMKNPRIMKMSGIDYMMYGKNADEEFLKVATLILEMDVFKNPADYDLESLNVIFKFYKKTDNTKYLKNFLFYLAGRHGISPDVRERVLTEIDKLKLSGEYGLHERMRSELGRGKKKVLIFHNIRDGLGDELIRNKTLMQSLLDFNPDLEIDIVTDRRFLYDHPRVHTIQMPKKMRSQKERQQVFTSLAASYDIFVHHHDDRQTYDRVLSRQFNLKYFAELQSAALFLETSKASDKFIYETVSINGVRHEDYLGLSETSIDNVYDPIFRLHAALGIPFVTGSEKPKSEPLLVGIRDPESEEEWLEITKANRDDEGNMIRPIALINSYGGEYPTKGFASTGSKEAKGKKGKHDIPALVRELEILIKQGYFVVVVPNGKPWGRKSTTDSMVRHMVGRKYRAFIKVAPEMPSKPKHLKYFLSYLQPGRDIFKTVEGGGMHMAANMGVAYDLVLTRGAGAKRWFPLGRNQAQRVVRKLSDKKKAPTVRSETGLMYSYSTPNALDARMKGYEEIMEVVAGRLANKTDPSWDEEKIRILADQVKNELNLRPVRGRWTLANVTQFGDRMYKTSVAGLDSDGGYDFVQIGYLFFLDAKLAENLSDDLKAKLSTNLILIDELARSTLGTLDDDKVTFKDYTVATILAMMNGSIDEKRVIDIGAGDGILSLVAAKLGAAELILVDYDNYALDRAKKQLEFNGFKDDKDFLLISADITNKEDVLNHLKETSLDTALLINIGNWPKNYGDVTNSTGISLIPRIEKLTKSSVLEVYLGGYQINPRSIRANDYGKHDPEDDLLLIESMGLVVQPDRARVVDSVTLYAKRTTDTISAVSTHTAKVDGARFSSLNGDENVVIVGASLSKKGKLIEGVNTEVLGSYPNRMPGNLIQNHSKVVILNGSINPSGLFVVGGKKGQWYAGKEYASKSGVKAYIKDEELITLYDKDNKLIYHKPKEGDENSIYVDIQIQDGRLKKGKFAGAFPNVRTQKDKAKVEEIFSENEEFAIANFELGAKGRSAFAAREFWSGLKGHEEEKGILLHIKNGEAFAAYDKKGDQIYDGDVNVVYENGRIKDGKLEKTEQTKRIASYPVQSPPSLLTDYPNMIVAKALINKNGLFIFAGKSHFLLPELKGKGAKGATIQFKKGVVYKAWNDSGDLIYRAPKEGDVNSVFINASVHTEGEFKGKIKKTDKTQFLGAFSTGLSPKIFDAHKKMVVVNVSPPNVRGDVYIGGADKRGKVRRWHLGTQYYNQTGIVMDFRDQELYRAYDKNGELIYKRPEEGDQNTVWVDSVVINGKRTGGVFVGAYPGGIPSKEIDNYPSGIIENVVASDGEGRVTLGGMPSVRIGEGHEGEGGLTVIYRNKAIARVYDHRGEVLFQSKSDIAKQREQTFEDLITNGDLESLIEVIGFEGAYRILVNVHGLAPKFARKRMKTFANEKDSENWVMTDMHKSSEEQSRRFSFEIARTIKTFVDLNKEDQDVLDDQIIRSVYIDVAQDHMFLDELLRQSQNRANPPPLRKAYKASYKYYKAAPQEGQSKLKWINENFRLRLHQLIGIFFIIKNKRVIIADEPGTGKTIQPIAAALNIRRGKGANKVLIVAPHQSIYATWKKEIESGTVGPQKVAVVTSATLKSDRKKRELDEARFVIVSYDSIKGEKNLLRDELKAHNFDFTIVDEAHAMRGDSLRTAAIREFDTEYKVLVTGTPIVGRSPKKIFNLLNWLYPEVETFSDINIFKSHYKGSPSKLRALSKILRPFILRRRKEDVLTLPPKKFIAVPIKLDKAHKALYDRIANDFLDWFDRFHGKGMSRTTLLQKIHKLRQATIDPSSVEDHIIVSNRREQHVCHFEDESIEVNGMFYQLIRGEDSMPIALTDEKLKRYEIKLSNNQYHVVINRKRYKVEVTRRDVESSKFKELDLLVEEAVARGEKIVIYTSYRKPLFDLARRYEKYGVNYLVGGMSQARIKENLDEFNNMESQHIFITTDAGSESIPLTSANNLVFLNKPWTAQQRDQIIARIDRFGQVKPMNIYTLLAEGTADEIIEGILDESAYIADLILDEDESVDTGDLVFELMKKQYGYSAESIKVLKTVRAKKKKISRYDSYNEKSAIESRDESGKVDSHVSFDGTKFGAMLVTKSGKSIAVNSIQELLTVSDQLAESSKELIRKFFIDRFQRELNAKDFPPIKKTLFWHFLISVTTDLSLVDYDPEIMRLSKNAIIVLSQLFNNNQVTIQELVDLMQKDQEPFVHEALDFINSNNVFKALSLIGVLDGQYYYDGSLMEYRKPIKIAFEKGRVYYRNRRIVDEIVPDREDLSAIIDSDARFESYANRIRDLTRLEEIALATEARRGNEIAQEAILAPYIKRVIRMTRAAYPKIKARRTMLNDLDHDDLQDVVQNVMSYLIGRLDDYYPHRRHISLEDYFRNDTPKAIHGALHALADSLVLETTTLNEDLYDNRGKGQKIDRVHAPAESIHQRQRDDDDLQEMEIVSHIMNVLNDKSFSPVEIAVFLDSSDGLTISELKLKHNLPRSRVDTILSSATQILAEDDELREMWLRDDRRSRSDELEPGDFEITRDPYDFIDDHYVVEFSGDVDDNSSTIARPSVFSESADDNNSVNAGLMEVNDVGMAESDGSRMSQEPSSKSIIATRDLLRPRPLRDGEEPLMSWSLDLKLKDHDVKGLEIQRLHNAGFHGYELLTGLEVKWDFLSRIWGGPKQPRIIKSIQGMEFISDHEAEKFLDTKIYLPHLFQDHPDFLPASLALPTAYKPGLAKEILNNLNNPMHIVIKPTDMYQGIGALTISAEDLDTYLKIILYEEVSEAELSLLDQKELEAQSDALEYWMNSKPDEFIAQERLVSSHVDIHGQRMGVHDNQEVYDGVLRAVATTTVYEGKLHTIVHLAYWKLPTNPLGVGTVQSQTISVVDQDKRSSVAPVRNEDFDIIREQLENIMPNVYKRLEELVKRNRKKSGARLANNHSSDLETSILTPLGLDIPMDVSDEEALIGFVEEFWQSINDEALVGREVNLARPAEDYALKLQFTEAQALNLIRMATSLEIPKQSKIPVLPTHVVQRILKSGIVNEDLLLGVFVALNVRIVDTQDKGIELSKVFSPITLQSLEQLDNSHMLFESREALLNLKLDGMPHHVANLNNSLSPQELMHQVYTLRLHSLMENLPHMLSIKPNIESFFGSYWEDAFNGILSEESLDKGHQLSLILTRALNAVISAARLVKETTDIST